MRVLAIIPARGGSKGVPGKNIKVLGNKPLILHAIDCAKKSKKITDIVVTTDSDEIISVLSDLDIKVIKRPESLAEDTSNVVTAVQHAYNELREDYDIIILLQPTAPFRTAKDLDAIVQIFEDSENVENVVSVVPMDDIHPARMYNMNFNKELTPFIPNTETLRRQDLVPVYYRNGCFYAIRTSAFFRENSFMISNKNAYVMDPNWLVNIDTIRDFKLATVLYEDWKNEIADY
mgnify:CR=1 FL=1